MRQQEMENKEPMDQSPEETVEAPAPEAAEAQEPTPEEEAPQPAGEAEKLQEALREKEDQYLRLLAEYDNYRKRSIKEKDAIYPQAKADTVEKFLPIIDNFERAMQTECSDEAFKKGVDLIFQTFCKTMKELSVEEIGKEGEPFNPDLHNAVMHIEDDSLGDNVVAQVLQKGYRIGDRVVRYAMVKVAN